MRPALPLLWLIGLLPLGACSLISTQRPQLALASVSIPAPPKGAARPRILLSVEQQPWDAADAATRPEYDLRHTNEIRTLFMKWADQVGLFEEVLIDPFEAPRADYRVRLGLRTRDDPQGTAKMIATNLTYGLITTTLRSDIALAVEVRDRKGIVLGKRALRNADLYTSGLGALGIATPPITTSPASIDEELVMKALRFIAQSGIYASPAAARPASKPLLAPPAKPAAAAAKAP